jgi:hypothetical protein
MRAALGPTNWERAWFLLYCLGCASGSASIFVSLYRNAIVSPTSLGAGTLVSGVAGVVIGLLSALFLRRFLLNYELDQGTLRCRGVYGKIKWEEDLRNLVEVHYWNGRGASATFQWSDRSRKIPIADWADSLWMDEMLPPNKALERSRYG